MRCTLDSLTSILYTPTHATHIYDNPVNAARLTAEEARLTLALSLYVQERLSLAYAAQFAGLDRLAFQRSLSARDIPIHYAQEELDADLATVRWLREGDTTSR